MVVLRRRVVVRLLLRRRVLRYGPRGGHGVVPAAVVVGLDIQVDMHRVGNFLLRAAAVEAGVSVSGALRAGRGMQDG